MIRYRRSRRNESLSLSRFGDRSRRAIDTLKTKPGKTREQTRQQDVGKIEPIPVTGNSLFGLTFIEKNSPNLVAKLDVTSNSSGSHYIIDVKMVNFWPELARYLESQGMTAESCKSATAVSLDRLVREFFAKPSTHDEIDIQVRCSCRDFQFRMRGKAAAGGYLFVNEDEMGEEDMSSPGCKHTMQAVIRCSEWYGKLAYYIARQVLKVMPEEVFKFLR